MHGLSTARFYGQSARQVLAHNAVDDFNEDAQILLDGSRDALSISRRWLRISYISLVTSVSSLFLFFLLNPIAVIAIYAILSIVSKISVSKSRSWLQFSRGLQHDALNKLNASAHMQTWLDNVIRNN